MNRVYSMMLTVCICMTVIHLPRVSLAQCTCWTGNPATPVVANFTLTPTAISSASLSFTQFNPALGDLSCMKFDYNISASSIIGARNLAPSTALLLPTDPEYSPTGRKKYRFSLVTSATISGSGISTVDPFFTNFGPDSLGAYGQPDDSITYGPTTIINNFSGSTAVAPSGAYMGAGTAFLSYSLSGGLNTLQGGINFSQKIQTSLWGTFSMTYYWCPARPLASSIKDLTAFPGNNTIQIQWLTDNEQKKSNYEIQISRDGSQFNTTGEIQGDPASAGSTAKYQYQYHLNPADVGKLYFRIKETDASGKVSYSAVIIATPDVRHGGGPVSYQTYPNPATNSLTFQFNSNQSGRYLLELVNTAGQTIQQKAVTLAGTNQIKMDLSPQPAKGLYFLRTRDLTQNRDYVSKVLIN
ncbi:T9SS type A sorting domain-containing protein [Flavitalea flava]